MQILPIHSDLIKAGDNLAERLMEHAQIHDGDIIVVSSKVVATAEGAAIDISTVQISDEARELAKKLQGPPEYYQAIIDETKRLNGSRISISKYAVLTELQPSGMRGSMLVPSAGVDQSNINSGLVIGWPHDPVASVRSLRSAIESKTQKKIAVIISDSCCHPRRLGVIAFALAVSGIDPVESLVGKKDALGRSLKFTNEARADQLATAANIVMGNADQKIPAAIIRDHALALSQYEGWVDGIDRDDDLFQSIFT